MIKIKNDNVFLYLPGTNGGDLACDNIILPEWLNEIRATSFPSFSARDVGQLD